MKSSFLLLRHRIVLKVKNNSILLRDTLWMMLGFGMRIAIQAVYFIVIARTLGSQGLGSFVSVVAIVSILAPFATMGTGNILIKNVARDVNSFSKNWGKSIVTTLISSVFLTIIILLISRLLLPHKVTFLLVMYVAISDMVFSRILDISSQAFQAVQKLRWTAILQVALSMSRLFSALLFSLFFKTSSTTEWGLFYLVSTFVVSICGFVIVCKKLGNPSCQMLNRMEIKEGLLFSISMSSQSIYNDIDKSMLAKLSTLETTGLYGAAYRIVDVSFTPIRSLLSASYSNFFKQGSSGIDGAMLLAKKILPLLVCYGLLSAILLFFCAPLIPLILGDDYKNTVHVIEWLSLIPLIRAIHFLAADALTGAGYQRIRSIFQVLVAVVNIVINFILIPLYTWKGAAFSSLISDLLLAIGLWCIVYWKIKQGKLITAYTPEICD